MTEPIVTRRTRYRITASLFVVQSVWSAGQIAMFTLMPIVAAALSGSEAAAGLPSTLLLLARATVAMPVGRLMDKRGRRTGLSLGLLSAVLGSALATYSVIIGSFPGFLAGIGLVGMARGAVEQARYVAAEIFRPQRRARIIGFIVFAGTAGSVLGPLMVTPAGAWAEQQGLDEQAGPFALSLLMNALALVLVFGLLRPDPLDISHHRMLANTPAGAAAAPASLRQLIRNRSIQLALAAMVIGQLVMTLIMVITPLHMSHHDHATASISLVIAAHTMGMFGLAPVTGWLVDRLGRVPMIGLGSLVLVASALLTPASTEVSMLSVALFLLGLGWNFCFVAGSSLLADNVSDSERGQAQGAGESLVALASGAGSLTTGTIFAQGGIVAVAALGLALSLGLITTAAWRQRRRILPRLGRGQI